MLLQCFSSSSPLPLSSEDRGGVSGSSSGSLTLRGVLWGVELLCAALSSASTSVMCVRCSACTGSAVRTLSSECTSCSASSEACRAAAFDIFCSSTTVFSRGPAFSRFGGSSSPALTRDSCTSSSGLAHSYNLFCRRTWYSCLFLLWVSLLLVALICSARSSALLDWSSLALGLRSPAALNWSAPCAAGGRALCAVGTPFVSVRGCWCPPGPGCPLWVWRGPS